MVLTQAVIYSIALAFLFVVIVFAFSRLYKRASKEMAYVRTGLFGDRVVTTGSFVLPLFQGVINVNLNTLKVEVSRAQDQALITKDRMRVDVVVECFVRVKPDIDCIATAAQTLGKRTQDPEQIRSLMEGKVTDALRSASAEMNLTDLHEQRADFVQRVQKAVSPDLLKNGLELESVSLTRLDQTDIRFFNTDNIFDSEGLTRIVQQVEERKKTRNQIQQDTSVEIAQKDLETSQKTLAIARELEFAKMEQERDLKTKQADQNALIDKNEYARRRDADLADIEAKRSIELEKLNVEKGLTESRINNEQIIQQAKIEQQKNVEIARQEMQISISEKSKAEFEASRNADLARAEAVKASEQVETVKAVAIAERAKSIEIIKAQEIAERDAVSIKVEAAAKLEAANDMAEALLIKTKAESDATMLEANAKERTFSVDAAGELAINQAKNALSSDQIALALKLSLIQGLPSIVEASVKPIEKIDGIKIVSLTGAASGGPIVAGSGSLSGEGGTSLSDQVVNSALRYRSQAPLIDSLMSELGFKGGDINGFTSPLLGETKAETPITGVATDELNLTSNDSKQQDKPEDLTPSIDSKQQDKPEDLTPSIGFDFQETQEN